MGRTSESENIVAIIQARMGSSRLPGKVLAEIQDRAMIAWVIERARMSKLLDSVVLATTVDEADDAVAEMCKAHGYPCVRGRAADVLYRYVQAAEMYHADIVVRLTGDCPLIDPGVIDTTIQAFLDSNPPAVYASNRIVRTFPIGLDVEVVDFDALQMANREAKEPYHREHVTPYFYEDPQRFPIVSVTADGNYGSYRWTVDTKEDLRFVREIFSRLKDVNDFTWKDVLEILEEEPELMKINSNVRQRTYREVE
jgi:spore coat polysaccharide biosynthesis protein SpsF